ncbi:hypothetical protein [Ileibacterium valens]|uniref:hypothetical protein n=1 Tax=Ileibacterium valens TaxID=1862668 RepID=UPI002570ED75|nr:hypothetical protein [Ileibacterium valens]
MFKPAFSHTNPYELTPTASVDDLNDSIEDQSFDEPTPDFINYQEENKEELKPQENQRETQEENQKEEKKKLSLFEEMRQKKEQNKEIVNAFANALLKTASQSWEDSFEIRVKSQNRDLLKRFLAKETIPFDETENGFEIHM